MSNKAERDRVRDLILLPTDTLQKCHDKAIAQGATPLDTEFPTDKEHAPIDSEIYALLDSIKATYNIEDGIVYVTTHDGEMWDFTEPKRRPE